MVSSPIKGGTGRKNRIVIPTSTAPTAPPLSLTSPPSNPYRPAATSATLSGHNSKRHSGRVSGCLRSKCTPQKIGVTASKNAASPAPPYKIDAILAPALPSTFNTGAFDTRLKDGSCVPALAKATHNAAPAITSASPTISITRRRKNCANAGDKTGFLSSLTAI